MKELCNILSVKFSTLQILWIIKSSCLCSQIVEEVKKVKHDMRIWSLGRAKLWL
ncbi:hypothetical protein GLYMA_02G033800v4 [Glycine max]|uniref:Uncharacterized protein n=1 Tax=Glycine max TaxID=3847 RepID=K7K679_SOYBN|nr:hypothetical protein JHK85_003233 [Glycine max]KAH1058513.1 hypothetical protein GYH30_002891 [Glycine max]KRH69534.1 hypothetical protein GLYMA_02G033800v4 [Glycine max]